jgi:hypothetical protein
MSACGKTVSACGESFVCVAPDNHHGACQVDAAEVHKRFSPPDRGDWIPAPAAYELNAACAYLAEAFGHHLYQVGSSLRRRDFRDVDVRCILPDQAFDALFPRISSGGHDHDARWAIMCTSISMWLSARTSLPIDFQIQRQTDANAKYPKGGRNALGILLNQKGAEGREWGGWGSNIAEGRTP